MKDQVAKNDLPSRAARAIGLLLPLYPDLRPALHYGTPFQLLVATVLSAQCTDAMVNRVTPELFALWPGPRELAGADPAELERVVRRTGFFRSKSRHLVSLASAIVERHGAEVPRTMEELTALDGVGRKTAGVVLSACFGGDAIIVDTHFGRVARRLGFAASEDPVRVEMEIAAYLPRRDWTPFSHLLNRHGRAVCAARTPLCSVCVLMDICSYYEQVNC